MSAPKRNHKMNTMEHNGKMRINEHWNSASALNTLWCYRNIRSHIFFNITMNPIAKYQWNMKWLRHIHVFHIFDQERHVLLGTHVQQT